MKRPVLALACLAGCCAACARGPAPAAAPAAPVTVATAALRDVPLRLDAVGAVEASSTVSIKPQAGGEITQVHFREGDDVRQGDLLFTIDPRPYEAALAQAEANLARDRAQSANADLEARRGDDLFDQGVLSKEQHDQLRAAAEVQRAGVGADEAAVRNARLQLAYCSIRAPIEGRTGSLLVHAGNVVKAIDGGPLVVINRLAPLYVGFAVPEAQLGRVRDAMAAGRPSVEALTEGDPRPSLGTLSFVDNAIDNATGTIRLKATFPNADRRLWPGRYVTVRLTLGLRKGAVVVPSQALQTGQAGTYVFVVKPDLTVETRTIVADGESDGEVVVEKGLGVGERVVTDGQIRLVPGAKVELLPAPGAPSGARS